MCLLQAGVRWTTTAAFRFFVTVPPVPIGDVCQLFALGIFPTSVCCLYGYPNISFLSILVSDGQPSGDVALVSPGVGGQS